MKKERKRKNEKSNMGDLLLCELCLTLSNKQVAVLQSLKTKMFFFLNRKNKQPISPFFVKEGKRKRRIHEKWELLLIVTVVVKWWERGENSIYWIILFSPPHFIYYFLIVFCHLFMKFISPFYLVDPASGICSTERLKPCKCKYSIALFTKLRTAHYTSYNLHDDRN